jgi:hypothetical protein
MKPPLADSEHLQETVLRRVLLCVALCSHRVVLSIRSATARILKASSVTGPG